MDVPEQPGLGQPPSPNHDGVHSLVHGEMPINSVSTGANTPPPAAVNNWQSKDPASQMTEQQQQLVKQAEKLKEEQRAKAQQVRETFAATYFVHA